MRKLIYTLAALLAVIIVAMGVSYSLQLPPIPDALVNSNYQATVENAQSILDLPDPLPLEESFARTLPFAKAGNSGAQYYVGLHYALGVGGEYRPDYCTAALWFDRAARQGDVEAQIFLAVLLATGQGVIPNYEYAYLLLRSAGVNASEAGNIYNDTIRTAELILQSHEPRVADIAYTDSVIAKYPTRKWADIPKIVTPSGPDIPIFGSTISYLLNSSSGCYEDVSGGFNWLFAAFDRDKTWRKLSPATLDDFMPPEENEPKTE